MLQFLFYFILMLGLLGAGGLAAWVTFGRMRHRRHRGRHHRHHRQQRHASPAEAAWLPIATFRQDGFGAANVLLWAEGDVHVGCYDEAAACWRERASGSRGRAIDPTFWMPVPQPPRV